MHILKYLNQNVTRKAEHHSNKVVVYTTLSQVNRNR